MTLFQSEIGGLETRGDGMRRDRGGEVSPRIAMVSRDVRPISAGNRVGQNAADGGATDLQPPGDFSFGHPGSV